MRTLFTLLILCTGIRLQAQPLLDKPVTVRIQNQPLGRVLEIIGETGGFSFSYANRVIDPNRLVSVYADNRPLRQVLATLLGSGYAYEQIGNHLVIKKAPPKTTEARPRNRYEYIISGYVRDESSGGGLSQVSIFESSGLSSTVSGDFGGYSLRFTSGFPQAALAYRREGYRDTTFSIAWTAAPMSISLSMNAMNPPEPAPDDIYAGDTGGRATADSSVKKTDTAAKPKFIPPISLEKLEQSLRPVEKWLVGSRQKIHAINVRDSFGRHLQMTLFPPIGTNGSLSGRVTNKVSLNLLTGYNGGVDGAEMGGLVNVLRGNMRGFQAGGVANLTGSVQGAQLAGVFNHVRGGVSGFQSAGVYNFSTGEGHGVQMAGVANVNTRSYNGVQIAGVTNVSGGNSTALQISGAANYARNVKGLQMSGFINVADTVRGTQIGVINIARYSTGGAIGIINIIGNGIHQLEFSTTDIQWAQVAWRNGTPKIYTILGAGFSGFSVHGFPAWGYHAGIGRSWGYGRRLSMNADLTAHELMYRRHAMNLSTALRLDLTFSLKLAKGLHISAGPSLTLMGVDTGLEEWTDFYSRWQNRSIWDNNSGAYKLMAMVGWKAAVRVF